MRQAGFRASNKQGNQFQASLLSLEYTNKVFFFKSNQGTRHNASSTHIFPSRPINQPADSHGPIGFVVFPVLFICILLWLGATTHMFDARTNSHFIVEWNPCHHWLFGSRSDKR